MSDPTPSLLIDASVHLVRSYCRMLNWNKSQFAREAGVRESTIRGIHRDDWSCTTKTLRKLEAAAVARMPVGRAPKRKAVVAGNRPQSLLRPFTILMRGEAA